MFDFFSVRSIFYFTEWTLKVVLYPPLVKIPLLVFMSEINIELTMKKSNFLFLFCFKIEKLSLLQCVSNHDRETASFLVVLFYTSGVFTGYDTGCKRSLQLKKSLKFLFAKQISRNRTRKNAWEGGGGGLRRPDVACSNNVTMALLVTSLLV